MPPTGPQLALLGVSVMLFIVGGVISIARLRIERRRQLALVGVGGGPIGPTDRAPADGFDHRLAAKTCMYFGLLASVGVLVWHLLGQWHFQASDNFDSLVSLAILLTLFVMYVQRVKPIVGLDWFVMPVVIGLLIAAAFFGRHKHFREYTTIGHDTLMWVHWVTAYGGAAAFAIAAAGGAMYVIVSRRLRRKSAGGVGFTNLERLERLMMHAVTVGFALLTIGLITGYVRMYKDDLKLPHLKLAMAMLAWFVYAIVMHAPINPRLRGRRAAMLSVFGFALVIATLIVVQYMPGGIR